MLSISTINHLRLNLKLRLITINASPHYLDAYTWYNIVATFGHLGRIIYIEVGEEKLYNYSLSLVAAEYVTKLL